MNRTSLKLITSLAALPMLLAAGAVSTAAEEAAPAAARNSGPSTATQPASGADLDAAAAKALAKRAESLSTASPRSTRPRTTSSTAATRATTASAPKSTPGRQASKPSAKKPTVYKEYVSLGDSWSADTKFLDPNGLPDTRHTPIDCAQSQTNYPKLLAEALKVKVHRDATCGSATTDDFYAPQSLPLGGSNPPQFSRLTRTTDLVTIGIGGNDAGVAGAALDCLSLLPMAIPLALPPLELGLPLVPTALPLGGCRERFTAGGVDQLAQAVKASEPKLVKAIKEVRKRSPKARILVVDYLSALPKKGCYPFLPMTDPDLAYMSSSFDKLNAMVRRAAAKGGAEFVDTATPSRGHDVCASPKERYVEVIGLSAHGPAFVVPAHPNQAGADAQFRAVLKQVRKR